MIPDHLPQPSATACRLSFILPAFFCVINTMLRAAFLVFVCVFVSACGKYGPLYLPSNPPPPSKFKPLKPKPPKPAEAAKPAEKPKPATTPEPTKP